MAIRSSKLRLRTQAMHNLMIGNMDKLPEIPMEKIRFPHQREHHMGSIDDRKSISNIDDVVLKDGTGMSPCL